MLCGVFLERELPNGNGHINVQLHDVLAIKLGLQHFRLYWRSGQALDWFCGFFNKSSDENREKRIVVLLLKKTLFLKVKSKESNYCERKQTFREPRSAWITPTDFEESWADMRRILLYWFYGFFISSSKQRNSQIE